jgi:hypothetical protein
VSAQRRDVSRGRKHRIARTALSAADSSSIRPRTLRRRAPACRRSTSRPQRRGPLASRPLCFRGCQVEPGRPSPTGRSWIAARRGCARTCGSRCAGEGGAAQGGHSVNQARENPVNGSYRQHAAADEARVPAASPVALAYVDQLTRTKGIRPERTRAVKAALDRADGIRSSQDRNAAAVADQLEALAKQLRERCSRGDRPRREPSAGAGGDAERTRGAPAPLASSLSGKNRFHLGLACLCARQKIATRAQKVFHSADFLTDGLPTHSDCGRVLRQVFVCLLGWRDSCSRIRRNSADGGPCPR